MDKKAIIVGAGIAGPLLAIQLQRLQYQVEVYEARDAESNEGVFLGVTPNGVNILKEFISLSDLEAEFIGGSMFFYNRKRKLIGALLTDYQTGKYGAKTIQVKRKHLYDLLKNAAQKAGISIYYSKRIKAVSETKSNVVVTFEDNNVAVGDLLFGCDGAFSSVRKTAFQNSVKPVYTKDIGTGGFAYLDELKQPTDGLLMTFGERGFFAYGVSNKGEVWWFNNYYREQEPGREEIKTTLSAEIKSYLLDLHKNDDPIFSKIINNSHQLSIYPVYDIPEPAKWASERICLVGDAAHATSPHVGQGASMAMEDTVVLCRCLQENQDVSKAFIRFQQLREPRVRAIIKQSRKSGDAKAKPGRIATWFRDLFLRYFIKSQIKKADWIYKYRP